MMHKFILAALCVPTLGMGMMRTTQPAQQRASSWFRNYAQKIFKRPYNRTNTPEEAELRKKISDLENKRQDLLYRDSLGVQQEFAQQQRRAVNAKERLNQNKWYDKFFPYFKNKRQEKAKLTLKDVDMRFNNLHLREQDYIARDFELKKNLYYYRDVLSDWITKNSK